MECVSYQGDDRASNVLQVADTAGRLDEQVRRAVGWFSGLGRFESYRGLIREDRPLLPQPALREALVNSVVHRDYAVTGSKVLLECFATHVDVTSPGGLPNHMRVESVRAGGHPRSRNESMANYMLVMGFMEQRGRGWPVMRRAMREFNGTEPENHTGRIWHICQSEIPSRTPRLVTELPNLMDFLHKFSRGARRQSVSEVHYPIHLGANAGE